MLADGQLGTTESIIYANPASTTTQIKSVLFHNIGVSKQSFRLHIVYNDSLAAGTPTSANRYLNIDLASNESFEFAPSYPLEFTELNDALFAASDVANQINYLVLGRQVSV